jgi:hypothetical protein
VIVVFGLIGFVNAAIQIGASTITQRRVPSSHMGRTSSLQTLSHQLTQGGATTVAAVVVATASPRTALVVAVVGFVCAAVIYWRGAVASERVPASVVDDADLAVSA